jgi:hypothetical protein
MVAMRRFRPKPALVSEILAATIGRSRLKRPVIELLDHVRGRNACMPEGTNAKKGSSPE